MQLQEWLSQNDMSLGRFAKQIDVANASVVRRYTLGRVPRPEILKRITKATKGDVTANDFVEAA